MDKVAIEKKEVKSEIDRLVNLAFAFRKLDKLKAVNYWMDAEAKCVIADDPSLCAHLYFQKSCYYYLDNVFDKALDFVYKSLQYNEQVEVPMLCGEIEMHKGNIYIELHKFIKAVNAFKKAHSIFKKRNDLFQVNLAYYSIGNAYNWNDELEKAKKYLKKALDLSVDSAYKDIEMKTTASMGILATKSGEYKIAEYYFERALAIIETQDNTSMKVQVLKSMGNLYNETQDYKKAIELLKEALNESDDDPSQAMELVHSFLADSYEKTGDFENALLHYKLYQEKVEHRLCLENQERIIAIEIQFKTDSLTKEAEIHRLKNVELIQAYNDLKNAQHQLLHNERLALLGQLSSGIAHEIQNPLNFVKNFAESSTELIEDLIEDSRSEKTQLGGRFSEILETLKENNQLIRKHGVRAARIVRNILMHAREKYEAMKLVHINTLIEESLNSVFVVEKYSDIKLIKELKAGDVQVSAHHSDIVRVFVNIIQNAVYSIHTKLHQDNSKFKPQIKIETKLTSDMVSVFFSNNGQEIDLETRSKIFHAFFTTKPDGEGTGLGLFLSKEIIEKEHNGKLDLLDKKKNTCFRIKLPVAKENI